jgi:apolipoprotein N-acyltransferase
MLPLSLTLVPGFVDIMTAVNDDVGATVFFSLFLWAGIRLIVRGFRWTTTVAFLLLAIACFGSRILSPSPYY